MASKPLEGLKVLDLTRLLPGPVCTLHLGDMGADVLKIEDTGAGDYVRWNPPVQKSLSSFFLAINRNKRAMKLDLRSDKGREIFLRLAAEADVVVEQFRPGVVDRLGIDYETVKAVNPGIVYCAITGYGQEGPYRDRAGHDTNYCAYAGVSDQMGVRDAQPTLPNFQIADLLGGSQAAVMGILAAVIDARANGQGRYVDVAMTDVTLAHAVVPLADFRANGRVTPRGGGILSGGIANYNTYETKDGRWMALGALEPKFWQAFCEGAERPDLNGRGMVPGAEADETIVETRALFKTRTQAEWAQFALDVDCCLAPVLTIEEAEDDPQLKSRGMFVREEHPTEGEVLQFAFPLKMSDYEFTIERHAPAHGEHSEEVLADLGYSADEITALKSDKVI